MSQALSKLQVRYIQSQKQFTLNVEGENKARRLPIGQLYVKDKEHFYLINVDEPLDAKQEMVLLCKEPDVAIKSLECKLGAKEIEKANSKYEEALLFFHIDAKKVKQLLLLSIKTID